MGWSPTGICSFGKKRHRVSKWSSVIEQFDAGTTSLTGRSLIPFNTSASAGRDGVITLLTDVGEFLVGAYLQLEAECDVVDYNVRPPGGGLGGLGELDVVGFNFKTNTAFICEVTTHIRGLLYKNNRETVVRIRRKHERQRQYAGKYLSNFKTIHYQFWSPVVPKGYITEHLAEIGTLELIINGEYKKRVLALQSLAAKETHDARNPVFRVLQVLEHLRD